MINSKEKNFVSAVVYVHNNENKIEGFLKAINEVLKENFKEYEIICVNDGSIDNSEKIIKNTAKSIEGDVITNINYELLSRNGKSYVCRGGFCNW